MKISVTEFSRRCLEVIQHVEKSGKPVAITRRRKVIAWLQPSMYAGNSLAVKPWKQLRAMGGRLLAQPGESVLQDADFDALR